MKQGKLYGLGVGPGDPELLTLKAVRLLGEADVVVVPDKGKGEKTALHIVRDYVKDKELLFCPTPMVRNLDVLSEAYDSIAKQLTPLLDQGKTLVYITLGDPSIYSTYVYVHQKIQALGYEGEFVPAVPSFCAVAARLGISLCERSERLMIVPASHKNIDDCLEIDSNFVFMKAGKGISVLQETLKNNDLLESSSLVANCGMEGEQVFQKFEDMTETTGYFSVVVVKK